MVRLRNLLEHLDCSSKAAWLIYSSLCCCYEVGICRKPTGHGAVVFACVNVSSGVVLYQQTRGFTVAGEEEFS